MNTWAVKQQLLINVKAIVDTILDTMEQDLQAALLESELKHFQIMQKLKIEKRDIQGFVDFERIYLK